MGVSHAGPLLPPATPTPLLCRLRGWGGAGCWRPCTPHPFGVHRPLTRPAPSCSGTKGLLSWTCLTHLRLVRGFMTQTWGVHIASPGVWAGARLWPAPCEVRVSRECWEAAPPPGVRVPGGEAAVLLCRPLLAPQARSTVNRGWLCAPQFGVDEENIP